MRDAIQIAFSNGVFTGRYASPGWGQGALWLSLSISRLNNHLPQMGDFECFHPNGGFAIRSDQRWYMYRSKCFDLTHNQLKPTVF